ncbi:hypothetical protein COT98_02425 [Candidatus Falkowbacteria bacterium CG10_big_fil_rev_8_21_14_0_10_39_9]|uniref:Uncharacterized protein n=1 Tax=Candidatus Falkowbacteria bacterium CG10_big_fil_rev_8_21_14_0_10_39_9 TaxID=1974566 RepID=A0A2M6WPS1_9BACT|nr:MAG: hypothetical protein COT98_02425 [Candidatus Falkowbacteria bacterium CG10_big_fil_rev_8_21_14_0_10_39_9]
MSERNFYNIEGRVLSTPNKAVDPETKAAEETMVANFMRELAAAGKDSIPGELFKTDGEKLMIRHFNEDIKAEALAAGVTNLRPPVPIKKIHFALPGGYQKQFPDSKEKIKGHHALFSDAIFIKKNKEIPPLSIAHITLHEMIHAFSATRYDFDSQGRVYAVKGGYNSTLIKNNSAKSAKMTEELDDSGAEIKDLFLGFNEGVTDLMAKEILEKHQAELSQDLNLNIGPGDLANLEFHNYCPWVDWIVEKVAKNNQEDKAVVWNKFKAGMLNGTIMHLRDIEKTLGPNSLRLVANIGLSKEDNLAFKELMKNYDQNK